jgi:hypothetical protein
MKNNALNQTASTKQPKTELLRSQSGIYMNKIKTIEAYGFEIAGAERP